MTDQVRRIDVVVSTKNASGLKRLSQQFGKMNREVKSVSRNINGLSNVFQGLIAGVGIREIARAADTFQLLEDRIKVFTGSAEKATEVFNDIKSLAKFTKSSVEGFAEGFNRVAIATKNLGLNTDEVLGVVTALQQSLRLSGSSVQEANSVFIQFSQALSLGRVQGQELRSILLSNATVANILADEFGVTTGELKQLGEEGKITADRAIKALAENFSRLNDEASGLGATFEQSLTIGLDAVRNEISKLNKEYKLNEKFATAVEVVTNNFGTALKALGAVIIPFVIKKVVLLGKALTKLTRGNVFVALAQAAFVLATVLEDDLGKAIRNLFVDEPLSDLGMDELKERISDTRKELSRYERSLDRIESKSGRLKRLQESFEGITSKQAKDNIKQTRLVLKDLNAELSRRTGEGGSKENIIDRLNKSLDETKKKSKVVEGTVTGLKKLNREFTKTGDIDKYRVAVDNLRIEELNKDFEEGKITIDQYNDSLLNLNSSFENLSGSAQVLKGLELGTESYLRGIGSVSKQVAAATENAFGSLEDNLLGFIKTGKFEFKDFAQSILDDLNRIIIRTTVIRGIVRGAQNSDIVSLFTGGELGEYAKGGAFSGGREVTAFANGGVVGSPTYFPMQNGTGLMGEAGPEAIMPLTRGPGGRLGVDASGAGTTVNVINNSSGEVETRESTGPSGEKQIDVIILDRMNRAFRDGKMDKVMKNTFNISRKGR